MSWDDGRHAKVKNVHITYDDVIYSIQVTYGTALQAPRRGSVGPMSAEFTLESDEYITALSGYALSTQDVVTSLTFTTNKKTYGPYGNKFGYQISATAKTGKQIAGFRGTKGNTLNSIDVHYAPIPTRTGSSETGSEAQKLHVGGLTGGTAWDDGSDHDGVTNIYVGWNLDGIQYVMFGYVKDGQRKQGGHHGGSNGKKEEIAINHRGEHLVSVEGWYNSTNVILGIQFKTNHKIYAPMGFKYQDNNDFKFTLQVQDKKIIGFHGFASDHLNSIGAYFALLSSTTTLPIGTGGSRVQKLDAQGVTGGSGWDDGSNHDGLTKIVVKTSKLGVQFVKFYYDNDTGALHGAPSPTTAQHIVIKHPDEYLVSVEGCGTMFTLQVQNKKIIGFHGFDSKIHLHSIGAYFGPLSSTTTLPIVPAESLGAAWDDGAHDKVKKVFIGLGQDGIASVKFEYINGSRVVYGVEHGTPTLLGFEEFTLELGSDEYITALSAYFETLNKQYVVRSLTFTTNKKTCGPYGNESGFQNFYVPEETGQQIAGFHGTSGNVVDSIGVHYAPIPTAKKLNAQGGTGGTAWDDGFDHDGVTKIYVRTGEVGVQYVKFDYEKAGQPKQGTLHGVHGRRGLTREIVINYPDEHLVSVEGWYDSSSNVILGIQFITNQKTSDYLGYELDDTGTKFTLQVQNKIIGFHGFSSNHLHSIGAYFVPLPSTTTLPIVPPEKLEDVWDDRTHDKVKKVFVGLGQDGIASVKFEYINGSQVVYGVEHGTPTLLGFEEFTLGSYEHITALSSYIKTLSTQDVVTTLTFTTNKKTYGPYGNKSGFLLPSFEETGKQIAGFHGRSNNVLNYIDVHYATIPTVQKLDAQGGTGGTEWDDGSDHDGVTNISVRTNWFGIQHVRFRYVKDGQPKQSGLHGGNGGRGHDRDVVINHPDEHLVSVEGWYHSSNIIMGIQFNTNQKTSDYMGSKFNGSGTRFTLQVQDKKINGFHGYSKGNLNSIGAYFAPLSSTTTPPIVTPKEHQAKGGESYS
ncbi:hypothetical protein Bca101_083744 [Brassica carinata]